MAIPLHKIVGAPAFRELSEDHQAEFRRVYKPGDGESLSSRGGDAATLSRRELEAYLDRARRATAALRTTGQAGAAIDDAKRVGVVVGGSPSKVARPKAIATGASELALDGFLVGADGRTYPAETPLRDIPPIVPSDGRKPKGTIVEINGIMTDRALQTSDMQALADQTGAAVVGVHNASRGLFWDLIQCIADKMSIGKNPAVDTTAGLIYEALNEERPLTVVAHSQGGLILSRALIDARNRLLLEDGLSVAEVNKRLSQIHVVTAGGAASHYVSGPQYQHFVNTADVVPMLLGVSVTAVFRDPGQGAAINYLATVKSPTEMPDLADGFSNWFARLVDRTVHGPQDIYWEQIAQTVGQILAAQATDVRP